MQTTKQISKRILSLMLSALMVVTMLPTFVFSSPTTAEAKDAPNAAADDYWQILASTDFTGTNWTRNDDYNWYTNTSPTTSAGGNPMGWSVQFRDNEPEVTKDNGVKFWYNSGSDHNQGVMYMSSYNSQTSNGFFTAAANGGTAVTSFKVDLKFHLFGQTKANSGYDLSSRRGENVFFKLCESDSKYSFESRYSYKYVYYAQESYGRRHMKGNSDIYAAPGTQDGGNYVLSTDKSYIDADADYHYIMYVADGWLCSYVTDASGNVVIDYAPIDVSNYSLAPADITGLFLNGSEFNIFGYEDLENVTYKSIEIYKGAETVTTDTSKSKYLYTYFTGNSTNGESLHYAVSDDGINFKPVNDGLPVWDSTASWSIPQYPTGSTSGVATSKHVRDPYILNKRNTSTGEVSTGYYILATDLNTQNGTNWGNNSKLLVYDVNNLANIDSTTPWVIDTTDMCASLTGGTVSRAWAPQAIWDNAKGKYMLYWSVGYVGGLTKLYYIYTSDFKTFEGSPKQLVFPTFCNSFIDADITYHNGIYYMYFKDEDAKKVYRAIAPHANGPYQGFTKFSDTGMEGPQVYELVDGTYALMTDVYGEGNYYIYQANNPKGFDASSASTTNVNYLSPRHGSVIRITPDEYNAIVNHFGTLTPNTVEYYWANNDSWGNNERQGTVIKDTAGHDYVSAWWSGGATVGGNKITLNNGRIYSADSQMCEILNSDAYTVDFTYKSAGTNQDDTHIIAAITKGGNGEANDHTYIAITASGKFFVNGKEATYTNASALTTAATNTSNSHRYRITYNGYATCLLVDNTYVGGAIDTVDKPDSLWLTFGFGRGNLDGSNSIDNNIAGEYGMLTISPTATNIGETAEDALLDTIRPDRSDIASVPAFSQEAYHMDVAANDGNGNNDYSNVVYCARNSTNWSPTGDNAYDWHSTKTIIAMPSRIVLVYDGKNKVSSPVLLQTKVTGRKPQFYYVEINQNSFNTQKNWIGWVNENYNNWQGYQLWPSANIQDGPHEIGFNSNSKTYNYQNTNTDTFRDWSNEIVFNGSFADNEYIKNSTSFNWTVCNYRDRSGLSGGSEATGTTDKTVSSSISVINYKPIYDILKSGTTATKSTNAGNKTALQLYDYLMDEDGEAQWMYTTESRINALIALKELADCNPNNYLSNSTPADDVATQVSSCATAIKAAKEAWDAIKLDKKDFTVTYNRVGGITNETVTAGNAITESIDNTAPAHIDGTESHKVFTWTSSTGVWNSETVPIIESGHIPHSNETYTETWSSTAACPIPADPRTHEGTWGAHHDGETADDNGYYEYDCVTCAHKYYDYDPHEEEWDKYDEYVADATAGDKFTSSSRAEYSSQIAATISGVESGDETKSASYITGKNTALETAAETYLNPLAEYEKLIEKEDTRNTNNLDENSKQKYTFSSWKDFATAYDGGIDFYDDTTPEQKTDIGKYQVDASNKVTSTKTTEQNTIETKSGTTNTAHAALANNIINNDSYDAYEGAKALVNNSLDPRKYTQDGLDLVNSAIDTADGNLYYTLTDSEITKYGAFAVNGKVKTAKVADTQTTEVLTSSTTINTGTNYLNTYHLDFTVQRHDKDDPVYTSNTMRYYGESVDLTVPAEQLNGYKVSTWSTSNLDDNYDTENPVSSQKASGRIGSTYTKVIGGNVAVVAELEQESGSQEGLNRYDVYDAYGSLVDVIYSTETKSGTITTQTITFDGGGSATAKDMPFYTFNSWELTTVKANHYKLAPQYTVTQTYDFDIVGASNVTAKSGTVTSTSRIENVVYDTLVTITSSDANFAAWAVKTSANEYQIASYNSTCTFYACADEDYVAIVSDSNGGYQTVDAKPVAITGANIDGAVASGATLTPEQKTALVNDKIANHKPFIAIEGVKMTDKQARVYARITQGATGNTGYGVLYKSGNNPTEETFAGATKRNVTSALSTGQFTYTLNAKTTFSVNNVTFRTFVNYPAKYKYNNTDYEINGTDYSEIVVATKNA